MEDEQSFSDICGGCLALQHRYYSPSCREFCLSCPQILLRSLTTVTCTMWLAAYGLFTLCKQKVIYYLCILLKDSVDPQGISQVVPLFQSAKPQLDCLIEAYRSCQEILAHQKATSTSL